MRITAWLLVLAATFSVATSELVIACALRPRPQNEVVTGHDAIENSQNLPVVEVQRKLTVFFADGSTCGGDSLIELATVTRLLRGAASQPGQVVAIISGRVLGIETLNVFGGSSIATIALVPLEAAELDKVKAIFDGLPHLAFNAEAPVYKALTKPISRGPQ